MAASPPSVPVCVTRGGVWGHLRAAWSGPPRSRIRELRVCSRNRSSKVSSFTRPSVMRNAGQALLLDSFGVLKTPIFSSGKLGRCRLVYGLDVRGGIMLVVQKRRPEGGGVNAGLFRAFASFTACTLSACPHPVTSAVVHNVLFT